MKRSTFFSVLVCAVMLWLSAPSLKAQTCNYNVNNGCPCKIIIDIEWFDSGGSCGGSTSQSINANTNQPFTCPGVCGAIIDVKVTVTDIGSHHFGTPPFVDASNTNTNGSITTGACSPGASNYNLQWGVNQTNVMP